MKIIKNELELNEEEYDALDDASIILHKIVRHLDIDEKLVADGDPLFSYDDVKNALYLLNTMVSCVITFEEKEA